MDAVPHPVRPVPLNYAWVLILLPLMLLVVVLRQVVIQASMKHDCVIRIRFSCSRGELWYVKPVKCVIVVYCCKYLSVSLKHDHREANEKSAMPYALK